MTGKTHQLLGFSSVYALALALDYVDLNIQTVIFCFVLTSLGSLTPDLDNEKNRIYTLVPVGQRTFSEIFERVFGKHRSITHSFLGMGVFGYVSWWLFNQVPVENGLDKQALWVAYMLALVVHVLADMYTKDGVPLLWPLKITFYGIPVKPLRIRTGGWFELIVVNGLMLLALVGLTYYFWDRAVRLFTF